MELKKYFTTGHVKYDGFFYSIMFDFLGIEKAIEFYKHSPEEYNALDRIFINIQTAPYLDGENTETYRYEHFIEKIKTCDVAEIKNVGFEFLKNKYIKSGYKINLNNIPQLFKDENKDFLLIDADIPEDIKYNYYEKQLSIANYIKYQEYFKNIPIDYFMHHNNLAKFVRRNYEVGQLQTLIDKHPDLFLYLEKNDGL